MSGRIGINDMKDKKTTIEAGEELNQAIKGLVYEIAKAVGIFWLIDKIPFLEKKKWVKDYE
jgi:hypothetical protein